MAKRRLLTAAEEMIALGNAGTSWLLSTIDELIAARVRQDGAAYRSALEKTAEGFTRVTEAADVAGRRRISLLANFAEAEGPARAEEADAEIGESAAIPSVPFREAVEDIVSRVPEIAPGWRATAEVYTRHGFACARATDVAVTERVRGVIEATVRDGSIPNPRRVIAEMGDWKRAYAETVYETNVRTAYTAGMWQRIEEPAVARVLLGMRFVSALLETSRPNHVAAHGLTAPTSSHYWDVFSPPLGYRCQCAIREISIFEARREGILDERGQLRTITPPNFQNARPDPGFGQGRPDRALMSG